MNCDVPFTSNACHLQGYLRKKSWTLGKVKHGLYYLDETFDDRKDFIEDKKVKTWFVRLKFLVIVI